jgi:hypothetical protein
MSNMAGELDRPFSQTRANSHFVTAHKIVLAPDLERFPVLAWFLAFRFRRKPGRYLALIRKRLNRPGHARGPGIRLENNIKS